MTEPTPTVIAPAPPGWYAIYRDEPGPPPYPPCYVEPVVAILGGDPEVRGSALGVLFGVASMLTFTAYYLINRRTRATTPIRCTRSRSAKCRWASGSPAPIRHR